MNYPYLIFDFDGTLADTSGPILATMGATIEALGLPHRSRAECKSTIGLRLAEIPKALFPERSGLADAFTDTYRALFPEFNRPGASFAYPGVIDTLRALHMRGASLAIASSRSKASLRDFTHALGIDELFTAMIGGEDVTNGKPDPEAADTIIQNMGWNSNRTLVIGDTTYDIAMGNSAGADTCGVSYGNHSAATLSAANPTYIIDRFSLLLEICGS